MYIFVVSALGLVQLLIEKALLMAGSARGRTMSTAQLDANGRRRSAERCDDVRGRQLGLVAGRNADLLEWKSVEPCVFRWVVREIVRVVTLLNNQPL